MVSRARRALPLLLLLLLTAPSAHASVVRRGYLPLEDGTKLSYTLTLPNANGRFPVVLQYDPYAAGATSDPTWNDDGYAMLGVNFRGTGCSQGVFRPVRADIWGADGAQVVAWAARQAWSDGNVGMLGFSFTGTSQIATAAYAGPALKAIMPGNVFPDLYRDLVYPGGILNTWIPAWIAGGRQLLVGGEAVINALADPGCAVNTAHQAAAGIAQALDPALHRFRDQFWARDPASLAARVRVPILGCVNWQDTTVNSRAFNAFRDDFSHRTTWVVAGDGAHTDCSIPRSQRVRFLDRYLKGADNGWEQTPHLVVAHEITAAPGRDKVPADAAAWESVFRTWEEVAAAIRPLKLYLHGDGRLDLARPATPERPRRYLFGLPSANSPADFGGVSSWNNPKVPGGELTYTTPRLSHDLEILGSGSANLWLSSTAADTDVQITLSEIRPGGREQFVQNGWLRFSHRKLDPDGTTALRPLHTDLAADAAPLRRGRPVRGRIELQPIGHVFRAGSAIRLAIDSPTTWLRGLGLPATNVVRHTPAMASTLVLGQVLGGRAQAPQPSCGAMLNQPCRDATGAIPSGALDIPEGAPTNASGP